MKHIKNIHAVACSLPSSGDSCGGIHPRHLGDREKPYHIGEYAELRPILFGLDRDA